MPGYLREATRGCSFERLPLTFRGEATEFERSQVLARPVCVECMLVVRNLLESLFVLVLHHWADDKHLPNSVDFDTA
jgi:hypothetical protein